MHLFFSGSTISHFRISDQFICEFRIFMTFIVLVERKTRRAVDSIRRTYLRQQWHPKMFGLTFQRRTPAICLWSDTLFLRSLSQTLRLRRHHCFDTFVRKACETILRVIIIIIISTPAAAGDSKNVLWMAERATVGDSNNNCRQLGNRWLNTDKVRLNMYTN